MFYAWHSDIGRLTVAIGAMIDLRDEFNTLVGDRSYEIALAYLGEYINEEYPDMRPWFRIHRPVFVIRNMQTNRIEAVIGEVDI